MSDISLHETELVSEMPSDIATDTDDIPNQEPIPQIYDEDE